MSYSPIRPNPTSSPALDVQQMQDNFAALDVAIKVNHVELNDPNQGKHNFVQFSPITGSVPKTEVNEYAIFGTNAGLFIRPPNTPAGVVSSIDINLNGSATLSAQGECILPNGLKMKWGSSLISASSSQSQTITYLNVFTNTPFIIQLSPQGTLGGDIRDKVIYSTYSTAASFAVKRDTTYKGTKVDFYWLAIGV